MKIEIVDNFLEDPKGARELAVNEGDFVNCLDKSDWHYNDLLVKTHKRDSRKESKFFSEILGENVKMYNNTYRKFNVAIENPWNKVHIHHDDVDFIAFCYLNEEYTKEDGTFILRHKETGIIEKNEELFGSEITSEGDLDGDAFNLEKWDTRMFIPMRYNRLVIFEPKFYHCGSSVFGKNIEKGRIVEVWHMNKKF